MDTIKRWGRDGDAVRQASDGGELIPLATASEECTDALLWCAIASGVLAKWAKALPAPRQAPALGMEGILASPLAARWAGLSARRTSGYGWRSAAGLGALGESVD